MNFNYRCNKFKVYLYWLGIPAIVIILFLFFCFDLLESYRLHHSETELAHAFSLIILTSLLAWIGWYQLKHLNEIGKNDFLLRIDNRYGSAGIVKARKIIHQLYLSTKERNIPKEAHIRLISEQIIKIKESKHHTEIFIDLLNLLDFLETIAYFANQNFISSHNIEELLGGSFEYFYKIF